MASKRKRRSKASYREAALRGWKTRRKNERIRETKKRRSNANTRSLLGTRKPSQPTKIFKRRSEAAKKGWRTRHRNEKKKNETRKRRKLSRKQVPTKKKKGRKRKGVTPGTQAEPLRARNQEYIVTTIKTRKGREQKGKQVDLFVIYIRDATYQEVIEFIVEWYTEINPESSDAWILSLIAKAQQVLVARGPKTNRDWLVQRRS